MLFLTFDSHHDGLVLSTIRFTRDAISTNTPLPFNQYGPAWSIFGTLTTFVVPFEYLMLSLRLLTLSIYALTAFLIYKYSKQFMSQRVAILSLSIYLVAQPFVSTYQSGFMSWPSTYVSPILLFLLFAFASLEKRNSLLARYRLYAWITFLLLFLIFTRLQVGLLSLAFALLFTLIYLPKIDFFRFFITLLSLTTFTLLVMSKFELFKFALKDGFNYGIFHAASDLPFTIPTLSLLGAIGWGIIYLFLWKIQDLRISFSLLYSLSALVLIIFVIGIYLVFRDRNLNFFGFTSMFQRRLWVSLFICAAALCIYIFLRFLMIFFIKREKPEPVYLSLIVFSLIGFTQSYPLFDQMHVWWGSVPLILVIARNILRISFFSTPGFRSPLIITLCFFLILNTVLVLQSITREEIAFKSLGVNNLRDRPNVVQTYEMVSSLIKENIPEGATVQNLCPDANVFLTENIYRSTSYLPVYWSNFALTPYMKESLKSQPGSFIMDCLGAVNSTPELFEISNKNLTLVAELNDGFARNWQIYFYR